MKFKCFLFILACFLDVGLPLIAQDEVPFSKAAQKAFTNAESSMRSQDLENAEKEYLKTLDIEPAYTMAKLRLGALYFEQKRYPSSKLYFEQVLQQLPDDYPLIYYKLGEIAWLESSYDSVLLRMETYLSYQDGNNNLRRKAEKYMRDAAFVKDQVPLDISVIRLKGPINTSDPEYLPSMPVTGDFMVFTRRVNGQEDFFISNKTPDGWSAGKAISDLNTHANEGAHCVSADGKLLIFTACGRRDGLGSCDLFFSVSQNGKWTQPRNLGPQVNTADWEGQPSLSANGLTLYFSSDRKEGKGGRDLWKVERTASGWGKPENLKQINTSEDDESPFIHWDDQTLYFMSTGLPGFGGSDLFLTTWGDSGWTHPVNLGAPLNTAGDEGALFIDMLGATGYFARRQIESDFLDIDLYSFPVPQTIKPMPVTYAVIKVMDNRTLKPLQGIVEVFDLIKQETFVKSYCSEDGEILVCLKSESSYAISIQKQGYTFYSRNIDLKGIHSLMDPYLIEARLQPLDETSAEVDGNQAIVLENVFFASGSYKLQTESEHELNQLLELLNDNPMIGIEIHGHTDNVGSPEDNQILSLNRSESIKDYLVKRGIDESRIKCEGFGATRPIASNDTEEGRMKNRRSEFLIHRK